MPTGAEEVLSTAIEALDDVLGAMFFSDVVAAVCQHASGEDWLAARVRFSGSPSGELRLMLSPGLAPVLTASFLGIDPAEVTGEASGQVCRELANIICGSILSRVHPDSLVALDEPELTAPDFENRGGVHQCFAIPEGTLAIHLTSDAW